jgi:RNA polymerase sigma-70 factor (ECF subfamily)
MVDAKPNAAQDVEVEMAGWLAEAHVKWPLVALGADDFRRHLERLERPAPVFPIDTYLAAACAAGDAAALRAFDEDLVARIPGVVRRVDASPAFAAEICQELRIRLFVGDADLPPRIARYTGEVPLSAWLRVIALRLAFNAKRGKKEGTSDAGEPSLGIADDAEIDYLRGQYREPFERALDAALAALPKDDRTILRLHYVDGVNIDGIGRIFQVHRATVARWLVRIRSDVLARAKASLAQQVGADLDEAASVMGALVGEIDVTLSRVLGAISA